MSKAAETFEELREKLIWNHFDNPKWRFQFEFEGGINNEFHESWIRNLDQNNSYDIYHLKWE